MSNFEVTKDHLYYISDPDAIMLYNSCPSATDLTPDQRAKLADSIDYIDTEGYELNRIADIVRDLMLEDDNIDHIIFIHPIIAEQILACKISAV